MEAALLAPWLMYPSGSSGHYEVPPFNDKTQRSAYHVREFEVFRLGFLPRHLDICLSHDWPRGIAHYGNVEQLLRKKSFLTKEVQTNTLGSPPAEHLLHSLQPRYWFSAHLHVKVCRAVFMARVPSNSPAPSEEGGDLGRRCWCSLSRHLGGLMAGVLLSLLSILHS